MSKKKILIINGPNLNLLGEREKNVYGELTLKDYNKNLKNYGAKNNVSIAFFQSNYEGEIIGIDLPTSVELRISITEPGLKGDTVTGGNKPAELETGANISVPLFINIDDIIKVDTRDGKYLERIKKA